MSQPAADIGFAGKRGAGWSLLARWLVPAMMLMAYGFMAATAETDSTGQAWLGLGFAFVMVLWFVVRFLTSTAAMSRALSVGDAERIWEIAGRELRGRRGKGKGKWLYACAFAFETRGGWERALEMSAEAATAGLPAELVPKLGAVRVTSLVELGRTDEAQVVFDRSLVGARGFEIDSMVKLAQAQIAWAKGDTDAVAPLAQRVIDDIRAGSFTRATAHGLALRLAESRNDATGAAKHRAEIRKLAPRSWLTTL